MFKSYLKTTLRSIKKHLGYSLINIMGLAIGMACCILILLFVFDELSYDKFHENHDRIYRVTRQWFTVSYQTIKASLADPVSALKYE